MKDTIVQFPIGKLVKAQDNERQRRRKACIEFKSRNVYRNVLKEFDEEYRQMVDILVDTAFDAGWRSKS